MGEIVSFTGIWVGSPRCVDCKGPIDPRRLEAIPKAKRCSPCQAQHTTSVSKETLGGELIPVVFQD